MGKALIALAVIAAALGAGWQFWYGPKLAHQQRIAQADWQCFEHHRKHLNDPDTALLRGHSWADHGVMRIDMRAKNALGAYVPASGECVITDDRFDATATVLRSADKVLGR